MSLCSVHLAHCTSQPGMLTPPSKHRQAVLKQVPERERERECAAERKIDRLAAQLDQERSRGLAARREQIALAQRERDAYLSNVRALFKMSPQTKSEASTAVKQPQRPAWSEVSTAAPSTCGVDE